MAPILSAMETGAAIVLHREGDALDGMAATIPYPNNLAIIGTVNMDETTHGLSDKVLDRAFAIELIEDGPFAPLYQCKTCARMWIEPELKSGH